MSGLMQYWPVVVLLVNVLLGWVVWSMRKEFASRTDVERVSASVAQVDRRVADLESELRHMPSKDDMHNIEKQLGDVIGTLREVRSDYRGLRELLERTEAAVVRHEDIFTEVARHNK